MSTTPIVHPSPGPSSWFPRGRGLFDVRPSLLVIGIATAAGLFFTAQIYFSWALRSQPNWWQSMYWAFGDWFEWALLSPAIFWLANRFSFSRRSWLLSLCALVVAAVVFAVTHAAMCATAAVVQGWVTGPVALFSTEWRRLLVVRTPFNLVVFAAIVCAWHLWRHYRTTREREAELAELRDQLAQAQLFALRMQLNPHFLYNTLNAVSSLMLTDVNAANRMVSQLGVLLRRTLESDNAPEIPLAEELAFLRVYLEIEQIRFGDRLQAHIDAEPAALEAAVPNFIFQPLVENALRHAIEHRESGGELSLWVRRQDETLVLEVIDNGRDAGKAPARFLAGASENVGLHNTRERLERLYGPRHRFALAANERGGVTATVVIPFRLAETKS